jgi:hypothetical protein
MSKTTLQKLERLFHQEGLDCALTPSADEAPERLFIFLGLDGMNRQRIVEITAQDQNLLREIQGEGVGLFSGAIKIQFEADFPFRAQDDTAHEVRSLLSFLNRMMELPGLELDEIENRIYYRYVFLSYQNEDNLRLSLGILGAILVMLDLYTGVVEPVADGRKAFDELLEDVLTATGKMGV